MWRSATNQYTSTLGELGYGAYGTCHSMVLPGSAALAANTTGRPGDKYSTPSLLLRPEEWSATIVHNHTRTIVTSIS